MIETTYTDHGIECHDSHGKLIAIIHRHAYEDVWIVEDRSPVEKQPQRWRGLKAAEAYVWALALEAEALGY